MYQVVQGIPGQPHRWSEAIKHWADGGLVQWGYAGELATSTYWRDCSYANAGMPNWHNGALQFRVAPAVAGSGPSIPTTEGSIPSGSASLVFPPLVWELAG